MGQIIDEPGTLSAPLGFLEEMRAANRNYWQARRNPNTPPEELRRLKAIQYEYNNIAHPFTGIHVTEKGLDMLEQYVAEVRAEIGYEVPLAIDHFGHIGVEDCIIMSCASRST